MTPFPLKSRRKLTHERRLKGAVTWEPCCAADVQRAANRGGLLRTQAGETVKSSWETEYRLNTDLEKNHAES